MRSNLATYYLFNTEQEALAVSKELYNLMLPKSLQPQDQILDLVFTIIPHQNPKNKQVALVVDPNFEITFHPNADKNAYINLFNRDPDVSNTLNSVSKATMDKLIPKGTKAYTFQELITSGHIPNAAGK